MKSVSRTSPSPLWISLNIILVVALVLAGGFLKPAPTQASPAVPASVDPIAKYVLERDGTVKVMLVLKEQADLSGAADLDSKVAKGQYVFDQLTQVAQKTQGPLVQFLTERKVEFKSFWIQNMIILTLDSQLLAELVNRPEIDHIEYLYPVYTDPVDEFPVYGPSQTEGLENPEAVEWNITRVGAPDVWAMGITGEDVVIGDLDTGVQWDHPALINQYRGNLGGGSYDHNYNWYDGGFTTVPTDYDTHGTHTMGTIVGDDGASNQIGVAPGAKWIACPGIGSPYVGPFECFQFFLAPTDLQGDNPNPSLAPHVINNSWSSAGTNFHPAIQALTAAGIFFAKSAGNTGSACGTVTNPGQWPEVTATAAFANGDTIASFSSRGPVQIGYDTFVKPDIAAPGVAIRSAMPGSGYQNMQGTSMAAPHITGAVALLISSNPDLAGKIDILQMLLKTTAEPKVSTQCAPYVDVPNDVWGYGILDVHAAVLEAQNTTIGTVLGTVSDSVDPLSIQAKLMFEDTTTSWQFNGESGIDGLYGKELPSGTYSITALAYGYLPETVTNVVVSDGGTTTQDIEMDKAPIYTVSGTVTEEGTGAPLLATIQFPDTPVSGETASNGLYAVDIAQGTYWMKVSSPGHTVEVIQVTVDENLSLDFELTPIFNYYMRTADSTCSPSTFEWLDATGGTPRNLGDDAAAFVSLPAGRNFTFYGQTYTTLYVVSNGIVVFGTTNSKWSGPIPDPATPNNGIYAFSTDLNPENGSQGTIYTHYLNDRYFVIEWHEVEHYPSGDPETFEIVLDLDTGMIRIQYLTVSNPADAVSGVENATGTEATQYAYAIDNPELFADGVSVDFYPAFSTPPGDALGTIEGMLYNASTTLPITTPGQVTIVTGSSVYTTTTTAGAYQFDICPAVYDLTAEADGYVTSPVVPVEITAEETLIYDIYLQPVGLDEIFLFLPVVMDEYVP